MDRSQASAPEGSKSWIEAGGAKLAVRRWGSGQPVICLHAIGHDSTDFAPFAARVGEGFEVIALDWPGQGDSPRDTGPVTAAHYANLLEAAIPLLCKQPPIVLGNSIGGTAALIHAARRLESLRGLVLCDTGGLGPIGARERKAIGLLAAMFRAGSRRAWWYPAAFALYYGLVLPRAPERRRQIIASAYDIAPVLAEAWEGFAAPESDLRELAECIQTPTLFAWARGDQIIAWKASEPAARRFPRHAIRMFKGGHAPFLEDPDAFAQAFLDGVANLEKPMAAQAA